MKEYILKKLDSGKVITVSDVHRALLPMIKEIDRVCKKNNIPYALSGGSALGALRHGGFIPWDDDFDIFVMSSDYDRFIDALQKDLDDSYHFQCFKTHPEYNVLIPAMKIRKKGTYLKEVNTLLANKCKDGDGLFIDVLLMDHCTKNLLIDLPFRLFNQFLMPIIILFENINVNPLPIKKLLINTAKLYGRINKNSNYIGYDLTWTFKNPFKPYIYHVDDVFPYRDIKFENLMLPVANNVETFLKTEIGETYMQFPPISKQAPKHIVDIDLGE